MPAPGDRIASLGRSLLHVRKQMSTANIKGKTVEAPVEAHAVARDVRRSISALSRARSARYTWIDVVDHSVVYDNPIPTLCSRHAFFPGVARLDSGELVALFSVGQAFESADHRVFVSRSGDGGKSWTLQGPLHPDAKPALGAMKPTLLDDGTLVAIGYVFYHDDPELLTNPDTGGLPGGENLVSFSQDGGRTWTLPKAMQLSRPEVLEISGPCIQSRSGDVLAIGTPMTRWDGSRPSGHHGVLLRSHDRGRTWDDRVRYFRHPTLTPLEARMCQMDDGRLVAIVWALDERVGRCHNNHVVVSHDDGRTWSEPVDIEVAAQASNLVSLGGERLLSIHAHRETEPAGIVARIVDFTTDRWSTLAEARVFEGHQPRRVSGFRDMGMNVKFGQPSLLELGDGEYLAYHWSIDNGQGRILSHRIRLAE